MNLVFVSSSLTMGGAERVLCHLAGGFVRRGHRVSVITTTLRPDFYELPQGVSRIAIDLTGQAPGKATRPATLLRILLPVVAGMRALRGDLVSIDPDLIIAFQNQVNVVTVAAARGRWPVVVSERVDSTVPLGVGWRMLRRLLYPRAAALVSPSRGVDEGFSWLPDSKRLVIHNPVDSGAPDDVGALPGGFVPGRFLVAMGRLVRQKGFDLLLEAFAHVHSVHPEWPLAIVGEGPERASLEARTRRLGLEQGVCFLGATSTPTTILRQAGVFVMSSRLEGFPNALLEAVACGLPVVSFDCPSGPGEIIDHGHNGLLVPAEDVDGLVEAIGRVITDTGLRRSMAEAAVASVRRFSLTNIVDEWERKVFPLARRHGG